jgi:electron transport complex protein RnfB
MSTEPSRRDILGHAVRGAALLGLGGAAVFLARRSDREGAWQLDIDVCINSKRGAHPKDACLDCSRSCVLPLSAVRAINDHARCGRCYICPAYFDISSAINPDGLPSQKLCPRDAIKRQPIGDIDPQDPANNYYEYVIDETRCNGCGRCVLACKEPAGLSSLRLEVRYNRCVDCNHCSIARACPYDAYERKPVRV